MEIDNFEQIVHLMDFYGEHEFYYIQILKRKKDNPNVSNNSISSPIKTYYIKDITSFDKYKEEIKTICKATNARAYIHLTKRCAKKVSLLALKKLTDFIIENNYDKAHRVYNSVCGLPESIKDRGRKLWIIDVDTKDTQILDGYIGILLKMFTHIDSLVGVIPTVQGYHIIVRPFWVDVFKDKCKNADLSVPDVHKNNPTLLYYGT